MIAMRWRSATTADRKSPPPRRSQRDLVEGLDVALDAVDLAEIGAEDRVDETGHEGPGVELAEAALVLELFLEILDGGEPAVVDGDDEVASDQHVQLPPTPRHPRARGLRG